MHLFEWTVTVFYGECGGTDERRNCRQTHVGDDSSDWGCRPLLRGDYFPGLFLSESEEGERGDRRGCFFGNSVWAVSYELQSVRVALANDAGGSLWISVLMHQMFNTAEVATMYQAEPWPLETAESEAEALSEAAGETLLAWGAELIPAAILAAAGVALFFVILRWMRSSSRKNVLETECRAGTVQMEDGNTAGKRRFSVWGWIGVVISAGYMIVMDFFVMVL